MPPTKPCSESAQAIEQQFTLLRESILRLLPVFFQTHSIIAPFNNLLSTYYVSYCSEGCSGEQSSENLLTVMEPILLPTLLRRWGLFHVNFLNLMDGLPLFQNSRAPDLPLYPFNNSLHQASLLGSPTPHFFDDKHTQGLPRLILMIKGTHNMIKSFH